MDKVVFREILKKTKYYNRIPTKGRVSSCDIYFKSDLDNDVRRILNSNTKLDGRTIKKNIIPSNRIEMYTRLEMLLG